MRGYMCTEVYPEHINLIYYIIATWDGQTQQLYSISTKLIEDCLVLCCGAAGVSCLHCTDGVPCGELS